MKTWILSCLLFLPLQIAFAACEFGHFHWESDFIANNKPTRHKHSLVYCGNTALYVDQASYDYIVRNQRANINMVLNIDDEYMASPCVPAGRSGPS